MSRWLASVLLSGMAFIVTEVLAHEASALSIDPSSMSAKGRSSNAVAAQVDLSAAPQVEVVVVREGTDLLLYIDDYASNAPVTGAQVDLHQDGRSLRAAPTADGRYRLPADLFDAAAAITLSVRSAGTERSMALKLPAEASPTEAASESHVGFRAGTVTVIALVTMGVLLGIVLLRHRRANGPLPS